jgi:type I restriction enzyme, R subunit
MTPTELNEIELVELPAHQVFSELGYETLEGTDLNNERKNYNDVLLIDRLGTKIRQLNPDLPEIVYTTAINQVKSLTNNTTIENNREFHQMLLAGVKVPYQLDGQTKYYAIKLVDFETATNNDFLAVRQLIIKQHEQKRTDHILFVNGLPLVLLEYKDPTNSSADIVQAYKQLGVTNYQKFIPRLFNYVSFLVISDRTYARYGTMTAPFERFADWNDPENPDKTVANRLDMMQRLMLNKESILEIIQNYTEYESDGNKTIKKIAQQHQYLGVKAAIKRTLEVYSQKESVVDKPYSVDKPNKNNDFSDRNKIGIIWHTTGSGKSLTMILYVNIISQIKELENPTFIILTDRKDLDEQLGDFFEVAGFPYPKPKTAIQEAESIVDLREKLTVPAGKIIFTTIQKFQTTQDEKDGMAKYPLISERRNIIIIADEAHRSQYKTMAQNLQRALPNALKIGFTGTPIEKGDKSTTYVFGDVLSAYRISDAVRDRATVEITCQSRLVQLHLQNKMIGADFEKITEDLDPDVIESLSKKWSELKTMLEDPDRLKVIAKDLVEHFKEKQKVLKGKAMLATSTKLAAARYADLISQIPGAPKCTCVISGLAKPLPDDVSEEKKSREETVSKHYKSKAEMIELVRQFKDENNDLELLIVCDMYLTGFDAPVTHTMYVDKPLRDHNLIQAISRVNRVHKDKPNGMIIDYIGITDDLKSAFRSYNDSDVKGAMIPTDEIVLYMQNKHLELCNFFTVDIGVDKPYSQRRQGSYLDDAIEEILDDIEVRKQFIKNVAELTKAYAVCTPHPACQEVEDDLRFFQLMRRIMSKSVAGILYTPPEKEDAIRDLVEEAIDADENIRFYDIKYDDEKIDLNKEYLEKIKQISQKNLKMELAYKLLDDAIKARLKGNLTKQKSFQERIEKTLSKYHGNFKDSDTLYPEFESVASDVTAESKRTEELKMTDEEIAFYDIIMMGKEYLENDSIARKIAIDVTDYLKKNLKIDWLNQDQVKAEIKVGVTKILLKENFPIEEMDKVIPVIMQQTENNYGEMEFEN